MRVLTVSVYVKVYFYPEDGVKVLYRNSSYIPTYKHHKPEGHH